MKKQGVSRYSQVFGNRQSKQKFQVSADITVVFGWNSVLCFKFILIVHAIMEGFHIKVPVLFTHYWWDDVRNHPTTWFKI